MSYFMFRSNKARSAGSAGEAPLDREKWEREIAWREREIALRSQELTNTRKGQRLTVASMVISALAVVGSVWVAIHVAQRAAESAQNSATLAASSAQNSAQLAAQSALSSAQQSAQATMKGAESAAAATRDSSQRAAAAARDSQERKWRSDLVEDQRRSIADHTTEYFSALFVVLDEMHALTARAHLRGIEPSAAEFDEYDKHQRQNLRALQLADVKIYLENREVSFSLSPIYSSLRAIDEDILLLGRTSGYSKPARLHAWCRLHLRLSQINTKITPALDSVRIAQQRQGISPPNMRFVAPARGNSGPVADDPEIVKTCNMLRAQNEAFGPR